MKTLALCFVAALVGCAYSEAPTGYSYNRPSGGSHGGGGFIGGGGFTGGVSHGGGFSSGEGFNIDSNVLEQVRQILVRNEGSSGHVSNAYGPPGHDSYYRRGPVDIHLGEIRPAIQVAEFSRTHTHAVPSYPSSSYGVPRRPSSGYGAPY